MRLKMHRVHTAKLDRKSKHHLWQTIIAEYEQLKISQRQFCNERAIKMDLFCYHYRCHKQKTKNQPQEKISFIPAVLPPGNHSDELRLVVRQNFELHIPIAFDTQHLIKVLQVLGEVSC
jgi:hypothetical protein